ncbi:uncharacterized protein [Aegilops tauschii subsp. strangulata]
MPIPQDEVGEISGSRSRAGRWKRRRRRRTPVADCSGKAQPEAAPSSQRGKRKASPEPSAAASQQRGKSEAPLEPSEGSKRGKGSKKRKGTGKKKAATSTGEQAAPASPGASHASSSSSAVSSPLRWPHPPAYIRNPENAHDPAMKDALEAYDELQCKYRAKRNGKLMARSSGFLIDWDEGSKEGTVLTSARIICSKYTALTQWSGTDEYVPDAEIIAHLLDEDETTVPAILFRYDKHINIAVLKVNLDLCAKIPRFSSDINYGQEILVLGRDERLNMTIAHGCVNFMGPTTYERHHYLFTGCEPSIGGMVIDFDGHVLGMANFPGTAYIPSSIVLKCLDMWKKFQCIPRLHIGMKLSPIKFLDPIHVERIFRKCNIDSGLIVKEVSHGSIAEELGVRPGDVVDSVNGECVATTVELENLIMRICENHLDQGGAIGSCMDILVGILHMRKGRKGPRHTLSLRLNVSDDVEVFISDCAWSFDDRILTFPP